MANLYLDLCLSDIPKERIRTAQNGKKYLKAIIKPRKEADRDGYDHYIAAFIPAEERNRDDKPAFIGRAQLKEEQPHIGGHDFNRPNGTYSGYKGVDNRPGIDKDHDLPF